MRAARQGVRLSVGWRRKRAFRIAEETAAKEMENARRETRKAAENAQAIVREQAAPIVKVFRAPQEEKAKGAPSEKPPSDVYTLMVDGVSAGKFFSEEALAKAVSKFVRPGQTVEILKNGKPFWKRTMKAPKKTEKKGFPWGILAIPAVAIAVYASS